MDEVRYVYLRPEVIRKKREACPVAYIPIGTIEWHGLHNPVGLDTLKAEQLCIRCAQAGGGLVFPALFYGENREEALMEANAGDKEEISAAYGLPPENFAPGYMGYSVKEQSDAYLRLLVHILHEVRSLGFKVAVFSPGHYPLLDFARAACALFHQTVKHDKRGMCIAWAFTGYELVKDVYEYAGDHAAYWETSLLLALCPGLSDLSVLPEDRDERLVGVGGLPPQDATAEFGEKMTRAIVERVTAEVRDRLEDPGAYGRHGLRL